MVQVVENRADVCGQLISVRDDPSRPGHNLLTLQIDSVQPVETYPNLLASLQGTQAEVIVSAEQAATIAGATRICCRARRAGPAIVFAEACRPAE